MWQGAYSPFGSVDVVVNRISNNFRFPGQYFDSETGLHYNWHRFYDPEIGRYVSADPIGLGGGINLYAYVRNDPVNWVDPWGLKISDFPGDVVTAFSGAAQDVGPALNGAANSVVDIAVNGPIEAQALLAHAAYVPVGLAAAASIEAMGIYAPRAMPYLDEILSGPMPHMTPTGYGMYSGAAKALIDLFLDWWKDDPCP